MSSKISLRRKILIEKHTYKIGSVVYWVDGKWAEKLIINRIFNNGMELTICNFPELYVGGSSRTVKMENKEIYTKIDESKYRTQYNSF